MEYHDAYYIIVGWLTAATSLFGIVLKHKEVFAFLYKVGIILCRPIVGIWRWLKLEKKIEASSEENKAKIEGVEKAVSDLSVFVKEKLSPNSGSSPVDAIKRIEARQITYENRQLALLNDTKYGIFFCTTLGYNTWVNRTYARFLDCGASELLGFSWKRFIRTDELTRYTKVWSSAFNDGCEFEDTVDFTNAHGEKIGLHINVSVVQNEKGETTSYIGQLTLSPP